MSERLLGPALASGRQSGWLQKPIEAAQEPWNALAVSEPLEPLPAFREAGETAAEDWGGWWGSALVRWAWRMPWRHLESLERPETGAGEAAETGPGLKEAAGMASEAHRDRSGALKGLGSIETLGPFQAVREAVEAAVEDCGGR